MGPAFHQAMKDMHSIGIESEILLYEDSILEISASISWNQCVPYNDDTKHLVGTTDMPDDKYINW